MPFTKEQLNSKQNYDILIRNLESKIDSAIKESQRIGIKNCSVETNVSLEVINYILPYLRKDYSGANITTVDCQGTQRDPYNYRKISVDWS
jgi:hypothetical protein